MSELDYFTSVLLGVVQGLTEFLPISSSGHLAIVQQWLALTPDSTSMLLFDVLAHVGTLIAVVIVFAGQARRYLQRLVRETSSSWQGSPRIAWRITLLALAATVPTVLIGYTFQDRFEAAFGSRRGIGIALIATGLLLALMAKTSRGKRGWKRLRWWHAGLIGVAQGLAILPGISRSGSTICVASYLGLRRRWAAEFSFLIAVPAIAGATLLKLADALALAPSSAGALPWGPIAAGSLISLVVGVMALKILLGAVRRAKLHYFAPYCWIVGAVVFITGG